MLRFSNNSISLFLFLFTGREKPNSIFKHMATNGKMCYIISIENVLLFLSLLSEQNSTVILLKYIEILN